MSRRPYEVRGVLAGAYRGKSVSERELLLHALAPGEEKTLCRKLLAERLCDVDEPGEPTCEACLARLETLRTRRRAAIRDHLRSLRDPDDRSRAAYSHALDVTREASSHGSAREAPRPWLEAAEAWEVAADAFEEARLPDKANQANATAHAIFVSIAGAYRPIESREMYSSPERRRKRREG